MSGDLEQRLEQRLNAALLASRLLECALHGSGSWTLNGLPAEKKVVEDGVVISVTIDKWTEISRVVVAYDGEVMWVRDSPPARLCAGDILAYRIALASLVH